MEQGHNSKSRDTLRNLVERIERLETEKAVISDDIKEVYREAAHAGYDKKIIAQLIKVRAKSVAALREEQALLDMYMGTLGMLDGTPLSDAARQRLSRPDDSEADAPTPPPPAEDAITPTALQTAFEQGAEAFTQGKKVIENPYVAGDPRRARWDEGWCSAAGSDGMDIPSAWRRTPKKPADAPAPPQDDPPGDPS